ncbi:long-chain-fatty-acid--CoA ligase [Gephyromycinifex aptenodytis]|uniref:long-chain-fatty-acid--CoA ligase n=1 Tax=Gephyromycinifex aptenodytis TaxID=2716227 RepID=UPI0014457DC6|nr:long-chain fatty acid--CoA ligase [Gephyromycinifex aptenodytis]
MTNLACNLAESARSRPESIALIQGEESWTYARLNDAAARFGAYLHSKGIEPGDRVAVSLPNIPAFAVTYYGALYGGVIVVPMNPLLRPREVSYYLTDSGTRLMIGLPDSDAMRGAAEAGVDFLAVTDLPAVLGTVQPLAQIVERDDEDTAVLLYTSGTTGSPKGAELRHRNLRTNQRTTGETLLSLEPDDVVMGALPLFHVFGMTCGLNVAIANGVTLALIPRFQPAAVLDLIASEKVTIFLGVPTMYGALLNVDHEADTSSLRLCISGGASMPVELMRAFEEKFHCVILEGYGLSETSPVTSFNHPDAERKPGSIGTPIRGVEMKLMRVDGQPGDVEPGGVGEIAIRGENIMRGYWNRPEATAEAIRDGWFYTGDLARVDEDGYYFIVDRTKDLIIRGGYNVYPREVEEVLHLFPGVAEAAVVGIPHDHFGEEVAAYVAPKPGMSIDPEELAAFVKERVAAYKYPREIRVIPELPKGATGKILKRELPRDL